MYISGFSFPRFPWKIFFSGYNWQTDSSFYNFAKPTFMAENGILLQNDPLHFIMGLNLYEYLLGSPINYTDPLGLLHPALAGCGVGAIWGFVAGVITGGLTGGACGALAGCVTGALSTLLAPIVGPRPGYCLGLAVGSLLGALCKNKCNITGCGLLGAITATALGCYIGPRISPQDQAFGIDPDVVRIPILIGNLLGALCQAVQQAPVRPPAPRRVP